MKNVLNWFLGLIPRFRLAQLRKRGLNIGINCFIGTNVSFDGLLPNLIAIGSNTTIAMNTVVLAHDASTKRLIGYTKIGKVRIGNKSFIGAGTIILPGISIGDNVVIGAGSVVTHDIPNNCVACGNPARIIESTQQFKDRHIIKLENERNGIIHKFRYGE